MPNVPARLPAQETTAAPPGATRTLLVSLVARHLASSRPDPVISDPAASALVRRLGLAHARGDWSFDAAGAAATVRTVILDAAVRSFAESSRHPTVITVGAGLCTRCVRLGDLDADWIDVDLPEAAALRAALERADGFRTAQEVYDALRGDAQAIGLTTVYRHLQSLAADGLADVIVSPDGSAAYRHCQAPGTHHHHLVCRDCGRAEEVEGPAVEQWTRAVADKHGYTNVNHTLEIFGTCSSCAR